MTPDKVAVRATAGSTTAQRSGQPAAGARSPQDEVLSLQNQAGNQAVDGKLRSPPIPATATLTRVELFVAEKQLRAVLDGAPPLVFALVEVPKLPVASALLWSYRNGMHRINFGTEGELLVHIRGKQAELDAFARLAAAAPSGVPAKVYAAAAPAGDSESDDKGERAEPLVGDESVLADNAALAGLYLDVVTRYAAAKVDRGQAAHGLGADQVRKIVADFPRAGTVTKYFTQAWKEYRATGGEDVGVFGILVETVLLQLDRGNYTALHNLLEVGSAPEGLGLYRRRTPLRYYDENGVPVTGPGGIVRDSGYRAVAPPSFALKVPVTSPGLLKVLESVRQVTLDAPEEIFLAAKGYADNRDLLWPRVRDGWDKWAELNEELRRQLVPFAVFLGGHATAKFLETLPDGKAKLIGETLEQILKISGKIFQIVFVGELAVLAQRCGRELSLVRRVEGQPLDALSLRHLDAAALIMRQLLTMALAAGLTAALVKAAEVAVQTLPPVRPGGPPLATATAGAGTGTGPGVATATAGGPLPTLPRGVPSLPGQLREGEELGSGEADKPRAQEKEPEPPRQEKRASDKPVDPREAVRERAKQNLEELQEARDANLGKVAQLEGQLSEARAKVRRLERTVEGLPEGSPERARASQELREARRALLEVADELYGYHLERGKQNAREAAIIASLKLERPSLWEKTKATIRAAAKKNAQGQYLDANTGEVIVGEPDYGHVYGKEHRRLALEASAKGMTQEQFTQWVNKNPEWFQLETPANNRSHKYEKPGID